MVTNQQLIDALLDDQDFDEVYNELINTHYVQTREFNNNDNPDTEININTMDKELTAKDIARFVIPNINNTKDLSSIVKLANHFMLTLYIACEVWELFNKHVLDYDNKSVEFDTAYWHPSVGSTRMIYSSNDTYFCVVLYIKPSANDVHTGITFKMNKDAADQDGYYLNIIEVEYWAKSSPFKTFAKGYNLAALNKNLIKKDLESLYK